MSTREPWKGRGVTPSQEGYSEAISALDEALAVLNRPREGLGYAWGLQRGQWGHLEVARARDMIENVRDVMIRERARERAAS